MYLGLWFSHFFKANMMISVTVQSSFLLLLLLQRPSLLSSRPASAWTSRLTFKSCRHSPSLGEWAPLNQRHIKLIPDQRSVLIYWGDLSLRSASKSHSPSSEGWFVFNGVGMKLTLYPNDYECKLCPDRLVSKLICLMPTYINRGN